MPKLAVHYGDNLDVLRRLPDSSIDLVYIDPPFNTGKVQSRTAMRTVQDAAGDGVRGDAGRLVDQQQPAVHARGMAASWATRSSTMSASSPSMVQPAAARCPPPP